MSFTINKIDELGAGRKNPSIQPSCRNALEGLNDLMESRRVDDNRKIFHLLGDNENDLKGNFQRLSSSKTLKNRLSQWKKLFKLYLSILHHLILTRISW